jgi:hypothetical protein
MVPLDYDIIIRTITATTAAAAIFHFFRQRCPFVF